MSDTFASCYVPSAAAGAHGGTVYESTPVVRASWYENGQHGGTVSALLVHEVEQTPTLTPMEVARVTVELYRVVPVTPLEAVARVVREGKKIQTTQVLLYAGDVEVARALVQRLRVADLGIDFDNGSAPPIRTPGAEVPFGTVMPFPDDGKPAFGRDAVEITPVHGTFAEPGDKAAWFRVTVPLVAGHELSPAQRAVIIGDFSNGFTRKRQPDEVVFMNSDLSLRFMRHPVDEWVHMSGDGLWGRNGRGAARTVLSDVAGPFAYAEQTLFLDRPPEQ